MAIFRVQRIVDAAMVYEADVEADTPEQATEKAQQRNQKCSVLGELKRMG